MRRVAVFLAAVALAASPAAADEELKFGPVPAWVAEQSIPDGAVIAAEAPVAVLLNDTQVRMERGKVTSFSDLALKIQNPEGLAAGNISLGWQPATDRVTVNRLQILRDGKVIDVLKAGQTFTIARRETNMEAAMLDGSLTANIQPEGLQVGDVINLAVTKEHVDPVKQGHVEATYGMWNGAALEKGHVRISWPAGLKLITRQTPDLPGPKRSTRDGWNFLELSASRIEPLLPPNGAPLRFQIGRLGEATDFQSWSEVAELMMPLFEQAANARNSEPLRDEIEKIRQETKSDKGRAEKALQLVQDRVRYVALGMGTGGYVPASAESTWSRRFGDCKAKSALLIAIFEELGIEAEPVLVHSTIGDALPQRLPGLGLFDHVIVRARIDGRTYWLDGTRSGDGDLDRIPAPAYRWGLPLERKASLVPIEPKPFAEPNMETAIEIDAGTGVFAAAPFKVELTLRGDDARGLNASYAQLSTAQLHQAMREYWRDRYAYVEIKSVESAFDRDRQELRWSMTGTALLEWTDDNWLYVPGSTIAYEPNFDRADGQFKEAPFAIGHPNWEKTQVTVRLPAGFSQGQQEMPQPIKETLAGIDYARDLRLEGSDFVVRTSERTLAPEVSYKDAVSAKARLKALYDEDVYLRVPGGYRATKADLAGLAARKPASTSALISRANTYLNAGKFDEAIADSTEAHRLDSRNIWALANRGLAQVWKRSFDDAEKDLAAADAIDPDNPVVLRARGLMAELKGDPAAAAEFFTKSLDIDPGNSWALLRRASVYSDLAKLDEAMVDFDTILTRDPQNGAALAGRASVHYQQEEFDKAFEDSEAALKSGTPPPQLRLNRANILRRRGEHDLVLKEAELLIAENPDSDYALVAAGKIFAAAGLRDRALQVFDQTLAQHRYAYVYINRSQVHAPRDYASRMADLDEALKLEPDQPDALALKAGMLLKERRFVDALQLFDRALEANPDDRLDLRRGRAVALYKSGKTEEAERSFAQIRLESERPVDLNNLCWDKAKAGILLESAVEDCREAVKLRPSAASYHDSLGMALLRLGRLDEAIEAYGRAIANSRLAHSFMGRAIAFAQKGDVARAQADRDAAVEIDSEIEVRFADYGMEFPPAQDRQAAR